LGPLVSLQRATVVARWRFGRSAPDGYTLYVTATASQVIGPQIVKNVPYHPIRDFVPLYVDVNDGSPVGSGRIS